MTHDQTLTKESFHCGESLESPTRNSPESPGTKMSDFLVFNALEESLESLHSLETKWTFLNLTDGPTLI